MNVSISCSCSKSEVTACSPFYPKHFKPAFRLYFWDIMTHSTCSISSSSVLVDHNVSSQLSGMDRASSSYYLTCNVGSYILSYVFVCWDISCLMQYLLIIFHPRFQPQLYFLSQYHGQFLYILKGRVLPRYCCLNL